VAQLDGSWLQVQHSRRDSNGEEEGQGAWRYACTCKRYMRAGHCKVHWVELDWSSSKLPAAAKSFSMHIDSYSGCRAAWPAAALRVSVR
jgi:hypothetical protein